MKSVSVVAAIIENDGKILCVKRGAHRNSEVAFKYEFPGGKVEKGETSEQALKREIFEELRLDVDIKHEFSHVTYDYSDFVLDMKCFMCSSSARDLVLKEHEDHKWLGVEELRSLEWAPADIAIVDKLVALK